MAAFSSSRLDYDRSWKKEKGKRKKKITISLPLEGQRRRNTVCLKVVGERVKRRVRYKL